MVNGNQLIYVYIDTVTNYVISKGLSVSPFYQSLPKVPTNLLLLDKDATQGEYENHTGFRVVKGTNAVQQFFETQIACQGQKLEWIDFKEIELLKQLSPQEIAELLYIAHAHKPLRSPFYYKLQNDFIYLTHLDGRLNKTYYRQLPIFYESLNRQLTTDFLSALNQKRKVFQRKKTIDSLNKHLMKELIPDLKNGLVFSFEQMEDNGQLYKLPFFLVEDHYKVTNQELVKIPPLGYLEYNLANKNWSLH